MKMRDVMVAPVVTVKPSSLVREVAKTFFDDEPALSHR